ncbi:outer membrane lipoprotein [Serratia fonticola]|uniref:Outer membrane lipoprotein n=1 Tax=Serratia fonticola TaxID=47917 RepID=A0A4U9WQQ4_SERFO|nr:outer membrane lipoprotein [Serratia fonticola]
MAGTLNACFTSLFVSARADWMLNAAHGSIHNKQHNNYGRSRSGKSHPSSPPGPVKLYKSAEELVGKPFRDLGEVSGESCQTTVQDSPPNLNTARKRMQTRASYMKANAVLLP